MPGRHGAGWYNCTAAGPVTVQYVHCMAMRHAPLPALFKDHKFLNIIKTSQKNSEPHTHQKLNWQPNPCDVQPSGGPLETCFQFPLSLSLVSHLPHVGVSTLPCSHPTPRHSSLRCFVTIYTVFVVHFMSLFALSWYHRDADDKFSMWASVGGHWSLNQPLRVQYNHQRRASLPGGE